MNLEEIIWSTTSGSSTRRQQDQLLPSLVLASYWNLDGNFGSQKKLDALYERSKLVLGQDKLLARLAYEVILFQKLFLIEKVCRWVHTPWAGVWQKVKPWLSYRSGDSFGTLHEFFCLAYKPVFHQILNYLFNRFQPKLTFLMKLWNTGLPRQSLLGGRWEKQWSLVKK